MSVSSTQSSNPFVRAILKLCAAGINLYALMLLVYIIAQTLDVRAVAELGSNFMPPVLLLALPLFLVCLLLRRRTQVVLLLPVVAYFAIHYGAFFLPRTVTAAPDAPRLRVLTYNLHGESELLESIINIIRESDADIVALQELTAPTAERFAAELSAEYPHQLTFVNGRSIVGQGVLSRYPLSNGDYWEVGLGNMRVEFEWEGESITLYNLHPPPPSIALGFNATWRSVAIDHLLERLADENGALILTGDFNMTAESHDYARMTQAAALLDAFHEAGVGLGPTFPNLQYGASFLSYLPPLFRIDYIFYRQPFHAVEAQTWHTSGSSDHYPVLATLALE